MSGGFFGFLGGGNTPIEELPVIFPLAFTKEQFVEIDVINIYQKILTDVIERAHGLNEEQQEVLWDNCVASEASHGLISLLARSMAYKRELFVVYDAAINVLRLATPIEQQQIRIDYGLRGESDKGVFISFTHFIRSDLIMLYSALEYCTIASLHKSMNVAAALQLKMSELRKGVNLTDSAEVKAQAQLIAKSLGRGRDILLDAKDSIDTTMPDLTSVTASIEYLNEKRAFYLNMPSSYICGEQTGGIGSTGEADTKAVERGLKNYFYSVVKPVVQAIFDIELTYKSQDFRQVDQGINALKTFAVTDDTLISAENKTLILNKLFDLPEDAEGDEPEPQEKLTPEQIAVNNSYPVI